MKEEKKERTGEEKKHNKLNKNQIEKEMKQELEEIMEEEAGARKYRMAEAVSKKDTKRVLELISAEAEAAFVRFFKLTREEGKKMKGRGEVKIRNTEERPGERETGEKTEESEYLDQCAAYFALQGRRIDHCVARLRSNDHDETNKRLSQETLAKVVATVPSWDEEVKEKIRR